MNRYTEADLARHIKMADDFKARSGVHPCNPAEDGVCEALECPRADDTALLRQALVALEDAHGLVNSLRVYNEVEDAIFALRQRLAM